MSRASVITLPRWKNAVASAGTSHAKAVFLGTSTTQGGNATDHSKRFLEIIGRRLTRNSYSSKYIQYFSPQADLTSSYTSYFAYNDGSGSHTLVNEGLSLRTVTLTNGASVSITLNTSAITVLFVQGSSYGQGVVTVDATPHNMPTDARAGDNHDGAFDVTGLSYGSHTVTISAPVSGSIKFTGLISHDYASGDPTKGIYFYNSGHGGFNTNNFTGQTYLYNRIASIAPQLVMLMFGTNDYGASMAINIYTSNMNSIIASVKAASPNAEIIIVTPYRRLDLVGSVPWSSYRTANNAIAVANGCTSIDLTEKYPDSQTLDSANLIDTDDLHQTDAGHAYMYRLIYSCGVV